MQTRSGHIAAVAAALLLLIGTWQVAEGTYVLLKAQVAQYLLTNAWERTLGGEQQVRPWQWADTWPLARLRVQRLGVDQIVLAGASGRTLAFGPGHISGTATTAAAGNIVISGHRDTHFRFLKDLLPGDGIEFMSPDGKRTEFIVEKIKIVEKNATWLLQSSRQSRMTLVTCYPFDGVTSGSELRYAVIAERRL